MPTDLTPDQIKKALRAVKDPELGLNIVDIGLVYETAVNDEGHVHVKMTLTSPGCPAGAIQFADSLMSLISSMAAAAILVTASPTAMRPEAGASRLASGVRSPMLMASPAKPR